MTAALDHMGRIWHMARSTRILRFAAFTALLSLPLAACSEKKDAAAAPPRPVLSTVISADAAQPYSFTGTVEPRYRTDLAFRVLGRVIAREVDVGDLVRKGQRVAALDPTALELALRSQRAALATAQAQLTNAAGVESRQETLRDKNVAPQATFEAAEQSRVAADAQLVSAQSNLQKAEEQLSYTQLVTDFEGVVTAVNVEVGQVVSAGQTVVTVARPDVREAVVDIPESVNGDVQIGTRFDVALQLNETIRTAGRVREVAPEADSATRSRRVRITMDDPPESFRLGTTITAMLAGSSAASGVRLPVSAVLERDGRTFVFVVDETAATVAEQEITVAARTGASVRISEGLVPGTRVVTAGVHSLSPGQKIKLDQKISLENGASSGAIVP